MLFRKPTLDAIGRREVTLAFRIWKRPTVREGGTLLTDAGQLAIESVRKTQLAAITATDAKRAGFEDREELLTELSHGREGDLYRIEFRLLGDDPRIALRKRDKLAPAEMEETLARLARLDRHAVQPWTAQYLDLIRANPSTRAADLAAGLGLETAPFKVNVRKLKALGLTESMDVGYRLSPRGRAILAALKKPKHKRTAK